MDQNISLSLSRLDYMSKQEEPTVTNGNTLTHTFQNPKMTIFQKVWTTENINIYLKRNYSMPN